MFVADVPVLMLATSVFEIGMFVDDSGGSSAVFVTFVGEQGLCFLDRFLGGDD